MQASMFNVTVPLPERDEVFLMNTFTDAQLVVSTGRGAARLARAPRRRRAAAFNADERAAFETLADHGFIVESRDAERAALDGFFPDFREDTSQLRVTVLTTLQCNFACDYCIQGDHGDYNKTAHKMSLETAARVADWAERELDALAPEASSLTFFGGEPLLNLPVVYYLAERLHGAAQARGVAQLVNIITNGLLLTPEVVARLKPFGLNGVKITLDGDQATHDRHASAARRPGHVRPIIANIRADCRPVPHRHRRQLRRATASRATRRCSTSWRAGLRAGASARSSSNQSSRRLAGAAAGPKGLIPLTLGGADGKPLGGACMTAAGSARHARRAGRERLRLVPLRRREDVVPARRDAQARLPDARRRAHGPCEIHKRHAHTIGPDGALYACPGFAGEARFGRPHRRLR